MIRASGASDKLKFWVQRKVEIWFMYNPWLEKNPQKNIIFHEELTCHKKFLSYPRRTYIQSETVPRRDEDLEVAWSVRQEHFTLS